MPHYPHSLSRRDFLKLASLGVGTLALRPFTRGLYLPEFPAAERLGRNCTNGKIPVKARPYVSSATVKEVYEDTIFPWLREVNADSPDYNRIIQRWVETPDGFIYSPYLQPVRNLPNTPLTALPAGKTGFWAEVTVPYVDFIMDNPPPRSPGLKYLMDNKMPTRLYYSQIFWIDQVKVSDVTGNLIYRVNENAGRPDGVTGGSYGDIYWAEGAAFRPLTADEVSPITPDVDPATKKVIVNLTFQTLSCFEGDREVYFCRVSTGVSDNSTPIGEHTTWRKTYSIHMAGGTVDGEGGYDTAGVSWTTLFSGEGVAIHGAFWHNQFGEKRSHGCVNCAPEDAKWVFRWTSPSVSLDQSDLTTTTGGTHVVVEQDI
jgi:lipoprotein-anchoring transpeptidase ErfK/SrfK